MCQRQPCRRSASRFDPNPCCRAARFREHRADQRVKRPYHPVVQEIVSVNANHPVSLPSLFRTLGTHRRLIWDLVRRDVSGRFRGSLAGMSWSIVNPILMLVVYTFVFGVVFKSRWTESLGDGHSQFALVLFVGLMVFGVVADCLTRACAVIRGNTNYVKRVVFPLEILPVVGILAAGFNFLVSLVVFVVASFLANDGIPWQSVYLPILLVPLLLGLLGVCWLLASLGLYVPDVSQFIGIGTSVLMFMSPIFYPLSAVPERYRFFVELNPLSFYVEQARVALLWGGSPDWRGWTWHLIAALAVAWAGYWWFQKTRKGFADVL